ncbi:carboxypeptidase-like regulatory domain-containing protein [Persicobacter sp. CCB-QB2]|uniref:TonB-dependent receptor n=1 Tax=Persicobacter sp. CCB-QB2 TaxID=1561025 RepID=UPI00155DA041|nr:carboxypeptidase-like regulatory domain-containing protein [Persicobacter sp. CCB-QB2]
MNPMLRLFFCLFCFSLSLSGYAQKILQYEGQLIDAENNTPIPFALIADQHGKYGGISDENGNFSFKAPAGIVFTFSSVGYKTTSSPLQASQTISLIPAAKQLENVMILANESPEKILERADKTIQLEELKSLPQFLGETDIIKNIQMQAGVSTVSEGTSSFFVRGGSADQNLILLDGVPIYEVSHLFGIVSVFNQDMLSSSDLYTGGIPARYGSRLSSVLDAKTKKPDLHQLNISGGVGLLSSRINVESPIIKEKLSVSISGRRSYIDYFQKQLAPEEAKRNFIYFGDLYGQIYFRPSEKDQIHISVYYGRDQFTSIDNFSFSWGNKLAQINWDHYFHKNFYIKTGANFSEFGFQMNNPADPQLAFLWENQVQNTQLFSEMNWKYSKSDLQIGLQANYSHYRPGEISPLSTFSQFLEFNLPQYHNTEYSIYIQENYSWDKLQMSFGLRSSVFQHIGPWEIRQNGQKISKIKDLAPVSSFYHISPRLNIHYQPKKNTDLFFTFQNMYQPVHQITNGTIPLPFNTWIPSFKNLNPQTSIQYTLGIEEQLNASFSTRVELFYKELTNVSEFSDNAQTIGNPDLIYDVRQGRGMGRGVEFTIDKTKGKLKGQFNYTYSRSIRKIDGVNQGKQYDTSFDRPHIFNLWMTYKINEQWKVGSTFQYASGRPTTLPSSKYQFRGYALNYFPQRNNYRMPDFHRLDLSATWTPKSNQDRRFKSSLTMGVYNVYNRKNLFTIMASNDPSGKAVFKQVYLFPVMPTLSYNFEF